MWIRFSPRHILRHNPFILAKITLISLYAKYTLQYMCFFSFFVCSTPQIVTEVLCKDACWPIAKFRILIFRRSNVININKAVHYCIYG